MGRGRSGRFSGTPGGSSFHSFADNLPNLTEKFPLEGRQFGEPSTTTRDKTVRIIKSKDPVKTAYEFFGLATEGAESIVHPKAGMSLARLKDGSFVSIRETSSSDGSPAVDLSIKPAGFVKTRKIHFEKGEEK